MTAKSWLQKTTKNTHISISVAYWVVSGGLRVSQEVAVGLAASADSFEGLSGSGGASSKLNHVAVGGRPSSPPGL